MSKDGGPAFPIDVMGHMCAGMSLRDYFAAQALPALICTTSESYHADIRRGVPRSDVERAFASCTESLPLAAYILADRMLAQRAQVRP